MDLVFTVVQSWPVVFYRAWFLPYDFYVLLSYVCVWGHKNTTVSNWFSISGQCRFVIEDRISDLIFWGSRFNLYSTLDYYPIKIRWTIFYYKFYIPTNNKSLKIHFKKIMERLQAKLMTGFLWNTRFICNRLEKPNKRAFADRYAPFIL